MASVVNRILLVALGGLLLAAIAFNSIFPSNDPYRCQAALRTGHWINDPFEHRPPFQRWQPDGCTMGNYNTTQVRMCMEGRPAIFSGDAETRQIAHGLARLVCTYL